jgi:hypothetical protein
LHGVHFIIIRQLEGKLPASKSTRENVCEQKMKVEKMKISLALERTEARRWCAVVVKE